MRIHEHQYEELLARQRQQSSYGKVTYAVGLEVREVSGYCLGSPNAMTVFADNSKLMAEQQTTTIVSPHIIFMQLDASSEPFEIVPCPGEQ